MTQVNRILGISDSNSVFVPEWQRPEMFELIVSLAQRNCPRICYVGAARGDNPNRIAEFFELASRFDCEPFALKLFSMVTNDPEDYFKDADVIFIDGGATRNLIALMREWNAIDALERAYESGVIIVGASAGVSMLFDWCISDSVRTRIAPVRGVGMLNGTVCAHYDVSPERREVLDELIAESSNALPAYGLEDGVAVLFANGEIEDVFSIKADGALHQFLSRSGTTQRKLFSGKSVKDTIAVGDHKYETSN